MDVAFNTRRGHVISYSFTVSVPSAGKFIVTKKKALTTILFFLSILP